MNKIPDEKTCIDMLEQAGCSTDVIRHCKAVCMLAEKIAEKVGADVDLVRAGALLHDIGRSKTHGIHHAVKGANIAKKLDLSELIIHIIERHIGAGLSIEVAQKLKLPKKDYRPQTLEEKIVCHADNLIDDFTKQKIEAEVEKALSDGLKDYAIQLVRLHMELRDLCGMDLNDI